MAGSARWYGPSKRERLTIGQATLAEANLQTANYTLAAGDAGGVVEVNSGSAKTVTVPKNVFAPGAVVQVCQVGAGQVTLAAGSGLTLRNPGATLKTRVQYSAVTVRFRSATEAVVSGDVAAS